MKNSRCSALCDHKVQVMDIAHDPDLGTVAAITCKACGLLISTGADAGVTREER